MNSMCQKSYFYFKFEDERIKKYKAGDETREEKTAKGLNRKKNKRRIKKIKEE